MESGKQKEELGAVVGRRCGKPEAQTRAGIRSEHAASYRAAPSPQPSPLPKGRGRRAADFLSNALRFLRGSGEWNGKGRQFAANDGDGFFPAGFCHFQPLRQNIAALACWNDGED